jgi:excisionase family DNA binding protein
MEQLLSVKELALHLKCTEQTIRRKILAKKIPYHKIDRMVRFWPSEIQEWVNTIYLSSSICKINIIYYA